MQRDPLPVTIYDTEKKQAVVIFSSVNSLCEYMYAKKSCSSSVLSKIRHKVKIPASDNVFYKDIAIRFASVEQRELIGDKRILVLDSEFDLGNITSEVNGFKNR